MKNVIGMALRAFGILVYLGLFVVFVVRLVTGSGDPITPLLAIIMLSGFSALFALVAKQTEAVSALVKATNDEIDLLVGMSRLGSLSGSIPQNDRLN